MKESLLRSGFWHTIAAVMYFFHWQRSPIQKKSEEQQLEIAALKQKLGINEGGINGTIDINTGGALFQNNPNPFSLDTEIKMALPGNC